MLTFFRRERFQKRDEHKLINPITTIQVDSSCRFISGKNFFLLLYPPVLPPRSIDEISWGLEFGSDNVFSIILTNQRFCFDDVVPLS